MLRLAAGGWRRPPASKRRLCGERGRAFRDSQNRAASERSDRVERAPGRAPEDEFLCKGGAPPVSQLGNCDLQVAGLSAQARSASGWAQGRIFSVGDSLPNRGGMAKGAKTPWLRSLPTFCRIAESRSPRGLSGGEERVIFSPRGLGPDGGLGGFVPGPSGLPLLGGNATENRAHGRSCTGG